MSKDCILYTLRVTFLFFLFTVLVLLLCMWQGWSNRSDNSCVAFFAYTDVSYILDAGHGGRDGGAVSEDGALEKDLNLALATLMRDFLLFCGADVVMTRETDSLVCDELDPSLKGKIKMTDLKNRLQIAKNFPEARFISVHMNKFSVEKYSGLQVYYSSNHPGSAKIAENVQARVREILQPQNARKVKAAGSNIYLLNRMGNPAILIECGFLSNREEAELLTQRGYQLQLGVLLGDCLLVN